MLAPNVGAKRSYRSSSFVRLIRPVCAFEHRRHALDGARHRGLVVPGIAEHQPRLARGFRASATTAARRRSPASASAAATSRGRTSPRAARRSDTCRSRPGGCRADRRAGATLARSEIAGARRNATRMRFRCRAKCPSSMKSVMIAWISAGALPVGEVAGGGERRDQVLGQHRVAEPQRRKQQFAEGAEIDHPAGAVEPLQRRQHPAGRLEFALVIVLDDPGAGRPRPTPAARRGGRAASPCRAGIAATASCRRARGGVRRAAVPAAMSSPCASTGTGTISASARCRMSIAAR